MRTSIGPGRCRRMSWRRDSRLRGAASMATPRSGLKDLEDHGHSTKHDACSVCCCHHLCERISPFSREPDGATELADEYFWGERELANSNDSSRFLADDILRKREIP